MSDITSPVTKRAVGTIVTPAMRAAPGGRRQVAVMALGLERSHATVLAERGAVLAKKPAPAPAAPTDDEEGDDEVAVANADGEEKAFDPDAALSEFVEQMLAAFPVPQESAEDRVARAKRLRGAIQDWHAAGQPAAPTPSGAPMAASAYPGANLTQRTLNMVQASKAFAGKSYDEQYLEAVRLVRAGAVI